MIEPCCECGADCELAALPVKCDPAAEAAALNHINEVSQRIAAHREETPCP